jgi:hypothetical protein
MNCPHCRRALWYERELSRPNAISPKDKRTVYYCASCKTLYLFSDFDTKLAIGGVVVMRMSNLKRAGFRMVKGPMYGTQGGEA